VQVSDKISHSKQQNMQYQHIQDLHIGDVPTV